MDWCEMGSLGTGLALNLYRIGNELADGRHLAGIGLTSDWRQIDTDWHRICTGLTDQSRIGIGLVNRSWVGCDWIYLAGGGEVVLRRDTSSGPYSKLVPRLVGQLSSD